MSSKHTFDYDDYLRGFRAACAQRGIDPVYGATGFQVVHFVADQRQQARETGRLDRWWQQHDLWLDDCPPYRSDTEEDALWNLFHDTYLLALRRIVYRKRQRRGQIALRELHLSQARRK